MGWTQGRFRFEPGDRGEGAPLGRSFDGVLLEAGRRLDEANRATASGAPATRAGDPEP